jgi:hypothetical protein
MVLGSTAPPIFISENAWKYSGSTVSVGFVTEPESLILLSTFSNVPVIWQSELSQRYQELGEALNEMTDLEEGDYWKIDQSVYDAASYVAAQLMAYSIPAPRILSHGQESVVFNWTEETNSLYLTISASGISALISTPQRIIHRMDYLANEALNPTYWVPSAFLKRPVMLISRSDTAPPDFVK